MYFKKIMIKIYKFENKKSKSILNFKKILNNKVKVAKI